MANNVYGNVATASGNEMWYYMAGGKKNGPIDASKIAAMLASGELAADTKVWTKGMDKWTPANSTELMNSVGAAKQSPSVINLNAAQPEPQKKKPRWWIWVIVGLVVAAIVGVAASFLLKPKAKEETQATVEVITYNLKNAVVFENEECAFIIDTVGEKGDYLELDVRCVNKTDDILSFMWNSTCVNGSMFDPLWHVYVQGNSTMRSSITFPLSTLDSYNLLPAEQIKFILAVFNEDQYNKLQEESEKYIIREEMVWNEELYKDYKKFDGFDGYLFAKNVKTDENDRPYFVNKTKGIVYFDEIYDVSGQPLYGDVDTRANYISFYNDSFGRPYYFSKYGTTIYYDGFGYGFYDDETDKHYFYDENGKFVSYKNGGIPEYYDGKVSEDLLSAGKPKKLIRADSNYIVHKEFAIYPTGKNADDVTYPGRVSANSEKVYWNGEKGKFIVLGGTKDEFKGYIVHTYIENNSDSYIYFGWNDVVVNGVYATPSSVVALRPHSNTYGNVTISADFLDKNKIKNVEEIDFRVYAVGENLSVPLYPITWEATTISKLSK